MISGPLNEPGFDDGQTELEGFTDEQKEYLAGFAAGAGLAGSGANVWNHVQQDGVNRSAGDSQLSVAADVSALSGPDRLLFQAQDRFVHAGSQLVKEEQAKRQRHPLDCWDQLIDRAQKSVFPQGMDVFYTKYFGLFQVAPAQNSFMCRLRLPGGAISTYQLSGLADIADRLAGGYAHVTTRANLQLREISASAPPKVIQALADLGIITRGSGADNIRNVTATPTAGFDPQEWYDTLQLARDMHHYILNTREMFHLPRKFNISFDGGGVISTLADTNDIGFQVVRVAGEHETSEVASGTYFRVQLAGISGHQQLAFDIGWLVRPDQCVEVAAAIVRVFIAHGDRTDRKKARLKYLVDAWGIERFLEAVREELKFTPFQWPQEKCEYPLPARPGAHLGFQPQSSPDRLFVGVAIPVGYMSSDDMRKLAKLADRFGSGQLRLTCWQNVLIPDIHLADVDDVKRELESAGFSWQPHSIRAGLVACTGNAGCKFAASDTKRHALQIAQHVEKVLELDQPVNIHLTGCHHSCAQHYIGDIGLIAAKVEIPVYSISVLEQTEPLAISNVVDGQENAEIVSNSEASEHEDEEDATEEVEGYHIFVGGGFGHRKAIGRQLLRDVTATQAPEIIERMLRGYLDHRIDQESFADFCRRHDITELKELLSASSEAAKHS